MGNLMQDASYGVRMLLKNPGFTLVAALALALGIGANTAIFSVVNTVLLRPLPFADSERLVTLWGTGEDSKRMPSSYPNFADFRDQSETLEYVAAYNSIALLLTTGDEPEAIEGAFVTPDIFPLLGVTPILGRGFTREEDQPNDSRIVLISKELWEHHFNSDPEIVGKDILISNRPHMVLGVMPAGFKFPAQANKTQFLVPLVRNNPNPITLTQRGNHSLKVVARLKPGVTMEQAGTEISAIAHRLEQQYQTVNNGRGARLVSMHDDMVGNIRPSLVMLVAAVAFVLLIACANVANLLLARAAARQKEMAIRVALGASRSRIVRQLLTESLLLSLLGGALGLLLALWGVDLLIAASPMNVPRLKEVGLDSRVLGFTLLVSLLTGLVFGLAPAAGASAPALNESLKEGARGSTEGLRRNRVRSLLVISEVALSLVLLVGTGLLIRSFIRLQSVDLGFDTSNVLTLQLAPQRAMYPELEDAQNFYREVIERTSELQGVEAVGAVNMLPLTGNNMKSTFAVEGRPARAPGTNPWSNFRKVSPGYFRAMGIPLLRGRDLSERDTKENPHVIIINETFARRFFPDEEPLGKRVLIDDGNPLDDDNPPPCEIIGIVGDIRHEGLDSEVNPEYYVSSLQDPERYLSLVVRTQSLDQASAARAIRGAIKQVDKDQYVPNIISMDELLANTVAGRRFNMLLLGVFAALALILAAVGIYGVMSYSVTQRTHEIGVRMALGARQQDVLRLVVGNGMSLAIIGVAVGLVASLLLTRLMSSLLFGVSATDPLTFIIISVVLAGVALAACFLPARRATKVDPIVALHYE